LLEGVRTILSANPTISLRVLELSEDMEVGAPGLYHAVVGRNGDPTSKLRAFRQIVADRLPGRAIALLKYCYVDVTPSTNPGVLFQEYCTCVHWLLDRNPQLTIVHVTLPLRADPGSLRYLAGTLRGLPTARDLNRCRQEYNDLLRRAFGGKEPIFDLAALESTGPDGRPALVRHKGSRVPVLAHAWTNDGGHLNDAARQSMGKVLLATLATAYDGPTSAP
jgi:hypothetical protein